MMKSSDDKRKQIIETCLVLFAEQGYSNTSISKIAQKVGMAKGLFYHYFSSKEEVLYQVVLYATDLKISLFPKKLFPITSVDEMLRMIDVLFISIKEKPYFWYLLTVLMLQKDTQGVIDRIKEERAEEIAFYMQGVLSFFKSMNAKDPMAELILFNSTVSGIVTASLSVSEGKKREERIEYLKKILCDKIYQWDS